MDRVKKAPCKMLTSLLFHLCRNKNQEIMLLILWIHLNFMICLSVDREGRLEIGQKKRQGRIPIQSLRL